jgi:hypothetical protein
LRNKYPCIRIHLPILQEEISCPGDDNGLVMMRGEWWVRVRVRVKRRK